LLPRSLPEQPTPHRPRRSSVAIYVTSCIGVLCLVLFLLAASTGPRPLSAVCTSPEVVTTPAAPPSSPPPGRAPGVPDERA